MRLTEEFPEPAFDSDDIVRKQVVENFIHAIKQHAAVSKEQEDWLVADFWTNFLVFLEGLDMDVRDNIFKSVDASTDILNKERDALAKKAIRNNGWKSLFRGIVGGPPMTYEEIMRTYDNAVQKPQAD